MRILSIVLAGALLAAAVPSAQAASVEDPKTVAGVSARQMALSRRYVELMQGDQLEELIRDMMEEYSAGSEDFQEMSAEDRDLTLALTTDVLSDILPEMMDRLVPVYARTFSEQELQALVDFYDSELGRSIVAKTMTSMPEVNAAMMEVMPQMMQKLSARVCAHFQCEAGDLEIMTGSTGEDAGPRTKKTPVRP